MNPRISEARPAPMMPFPANTRLGHAEAAMLEARRARDAALAAMIRSAFRRLGAWFTERRAMGALEVLSERELADIGLTRDGIRSAVRHGVPAPLAPLPGTPSPANDRLSDRAAA